MKITWMGTASILIETSGEKLLFDPFFRRNKKLESVSADTFGDVDYIFNTHPHFDHLCDLPQILGGSRAKLYGSKTMKNYIIRDGASAESAVELCIGETLTTKHCTVRPLRSEHCKNDLGIVLSKAFKILFGFKEAQAIRVLKLHKRFPMNNEIVAFEVSAEQKKILLFGSAGISKTETYPSDTDILIWAFQGRSDIAKYSLGIIGKLHPKVLILDHFDDAFPPITGKVDTDKMVKLMAEKFPDIKVIVPEFNKPINF